MDKIKAIKENLSFKSLLPKLGVYPNKSGFIYSIYKQEKTPSLRIYFETDSYFCFATNQGGDLIKFYKDFYRLTTQQAIDDLYRMINNAEVKHSKPVLPSQNKVKDLKSCLLEHELYIYDELCATASEQFAITELKKSRLQLQKIIFNHLYDYCQKYIDADSFRTYIHQERKITKESLKKYKIFYIGDYFEVNNHLKKSISPDELKVCGLVNEKGNLIFAKHRLIIPYLYNNEIVYLRGRYFDAGETDTNGPKYIGLKNDALNVNTAKRLYNCDVFQQMTNGDRLFITEGEFDAIILLQEGFFACAIPGAGNIPADKWFKKMEGKRICLLLDNDDAGNLLRDRLHKKFDQYGIDDVDDYLLINQKDISELAKIFYN